MTKAYLEKGWKVIAAVRDPKSMPKLDQGEVVVVKLDAGEKDDAKKVCPVITGPPARGRNPLISGLTGVYRRYQSSSPRGSTKSMW